MNLLTPKVLLIAVSTWKILSYVAFLLWNAESIPSEVDTSVNMVYVNVKLAYGIYYYAPNKIKLLLGRKEEAGVIKEGIDRITMELINDRKNIGPDRDAILSKRALQCTSKIQEMHKEIREESERLHTFLNHISDLADDVGDKSAL